MLNAVILSGTLKSIAMLIVNGQCVVLLNVVAPCLTKALLFAQHYKFRNQ